MLAASAVLWLLADASVERLAVSPPGPQSGVAAHAGIQIAHALSRDIELAIGGRAGAAYADDWRPLFEGAMELTWRGRVAVHAGARHDDRLRREGALADFRDPTGRLFAGVSVFPYRKGRVAAGATFDVEHAMPGAGRLPAGVAFAAVARVAVAR